MVIVTGTAIINKNKVLLVQSASGDQKDRWGPPAGHGEAGETILETAIRETKEETNLDVEIKGIVQAGTFYYNNKDYIVVLYLAKAKDLSKLKLQQSETSNYVWASAEEIENDKYIFRKKFLREPILMSLKEKPGSLNLFKVFKIEEN